MYDFATLSTRFFIGSDSAVGRYAGETLHGPVYGTVANFGIERDLQQGDLDKPIDRTSIPRMANGYGELQLDPFIAARSRYFRAIVP